MEDEDFLAAVEADNAGTPVVEAPEPPVVEPKPPVAEQPAPAEPVPTEPATPTEPPVGDVTVKAPQPDPGFVPIAALLDARDKAKALETELNQLRAKQPQVQEPDPMEDPEGYAAFQRSFTQQVALNTKLDLSEDMARERHGDDLVEQAKAWAVQRFAQSPSYQAEVLAQRNPYAYVVAEYQRTEALKKIGDPSRIDAFLAWEQAQQQLQQQPVAPAAPPNPPSAIPPRSLASAPSAGSVMDDPAQTDEEAFNEVMPKR